MRQVLPGENEMPGDDAQLPPGVTVDVIQAHLGKILASESFVHSERLSRFLRFAVEQVLLGQENKLKEYLIGVEVFDRQESFDPRIDSIVRVEARRLRAKLDQYYETDGRDDVVCIQFRKGRYVPVFQSRQRTASRRTGSEPARPRDWLAVAVLPFADLGPDSDSGYFSDGLTQEVINAVTNLNGLRVVARTSSFQFREKNPDFRKIGEELRADAVLTGSVRKSGERTRITAQLINVAEGYYLWSETYDRELKDVFGIQDEVSRAIVGAVKTELVLKPARPAAARWLDGGESWRLYRKGRHLWDRFEPESLEKSIEWFRRGIEADPHFAPALAGIADAYMAMAMLGFSPPRRAAALAKEAVSRAMSLNAVCPEAHVSAGLITTAADWDWAGGEAQLLQAIQYDPMEANASTVLGLNMAARGLLDQALATVQCGEELAPASRFQTCVTGWVLLFRREYDPAMEQFRSAISLNPDAYLARIGLGWAWLLSAMIPQALVEFERAAVLTNRSPVALAALAFAQGSAGHRGDAEALLSELTAKSEQNYVSPVHFATAHLGLGHYDAVFDCLETAVQERSPMLPWVAVAPQFDPIRGDRRFAALLSKMGLDQAKALTSSGTS